MSELQLPVGSVPTARDRAAHPLWKAVSAQAAAGSRATVPLEALLGGVVGGPQERAKLDAALKPLGTLGAATATVLEAREDGTNLIEVGGVRVAVKLRETRAVGESLLVAMQSGGEASSEPEISDLGKLISTLLAASADETAAAPKDVQPLAAEPGDAATIAPKLAQSVRESGLFYESHIAGWTDGRVALADLRREPQARLKAVSGSRGEKAIELPDGAAPMVKRQLDAIESGVVRWSGQPWPGQPLDLSISEDDAEPDERAKPDAPKSWKARLRLEFPGLGPVEATVQMRAGRATLGIESDESARAVLAGSTGALTDALAARGIDAAPVRVKARG